MGTPYARWTFYCVMAAACLLLGERSGVTPHTHDYSTNLWWQLMNRTAYEGGAVNCYVCAQLPYATHNSGLRPGNITDDKQMCLYSLSTYPKRNVTIPKGCKWCKKDYSVPLRRGAAAKGLYASMNCSPSHDVLNFPAFQQNAWKIPEVISLAGAKPGSLRNCVYNNGHVSLGVLPWNLCRKVYTYCDVTQDYIDCTACRSQRATPGCHVWKDNPDCDNLLQEKQLNISHQTRGRQKTALCSAIVPGDYGSRVMADWYFLCGNGAYMVLPRYWGGLCALVPLISPIAFIRKAHHLSAARLKRAVMPEVKRWGGLTTDTGVPWEFKIWNGGEKFMQGMFPQVGVGEVRAHVEINRYGLLRLINNTERLANGTVSEVSALREVVMQNRVVLDFLTASQGGVCKIIGPACCTFIPDETGNGGTISDALHELEELRHYVESGTLRSHPFDFLSWLTSGPWWTLLLRITTPVLSILFLFCLFTSCILPCLRSMMLKTLNTAVISYQLVRPTKDEDDWTHIYEETM